MTAEVVPAWSTHVGNNTVLEDDVVFLHKQEELAVARGLGQKHVAQVCCCTGLQWLPAALVQHARHSSSSLQEAEACSVPHAWLLR
ncbi:hypothetical protein ABBQ38_010525 [Trebouxia sp. C0009 RCD-2024]